MDTKGNGISSVVDEYAKVARETASYLYERAATLEKDMSKLMPGSGKGVAMTPGEGTKLNRFIEKNPGRAALFALMGGVLANRMAKSRRVGPWTEMVRGVVPQMEAVEASQPETTAKPKRTVRPKRAAGAKAA
jgi:hypothetical protein